MSLKRRLCKLLGADSYYRGGGCYGFVWHLPPHQWSRHKQISSRVSKEGGSWAFGWRSGVNRLTGRRYLSVDVGPYVIRVI